MPSVRTALVLVGGPSKVAWTALFSNAAKRSLGPPI
jgi:hypothetical protein